MATYIKEQVGDGGECCEDCSRASPCDGCECPEATLLCATASASFTKCGVSMGTNGCSPARYFKSGDFIDAPAIASKDCSLPGEAYGDTSSGCVGPFAATRRITSLNPCNEVFNTGTGPLFGPFCRWHYTDEYLTPELIDNMLAAVGTPGALATCGTSIIASFSLSSDEVTASGKAGDYAFSIPEDAPECYRITWDEVVTTNGTPSATPMEYTWDGVATQTPTYSHAVPGDNTASPGYTVTITLENITFTCTGCE